MPPSEPHRIEAKLFRNSEKPLNRGLSLFRETCAYERRSLGGRRPSPKSSEFSPPSLPFAPAAKFASLSTARTKTMSPT